MENSGLSKQILDYYYKFGQNRDIERFLRYRHGSYQKSSSEGSVNTTLEFNGNNYNPPTTSKSLDDLSNHRNKTEMDAVEESTTKNVLKDTEHKAEKARIEPSQASDEKDHENISTKCSSDGNPSISAKTQTSILKKEIISTKPSYTFSCESNICINLPPSALTSDNLLPCKTITQLDKETITTRNVATTAVDSIIEATVTSDSSIPEEQAKLEQSNCSSNDNDVMTPSKSKRLEWDSLGDVGYNKSPRRRKRQSNITTLEKSVLKEFFANQGIEINFSSPPNEIKNVMESSGMITGKIKSASVSKPSSSQEKWREVLNPVKKKYQTNNESKNKTIITKSNQSSFTKTIPDSHSTPIAEKWIQTSFLGPTENKEVQVNITKQFLITEENHSGSVSPSSFEYIRFTAVNENIPSSPYSSDEENQKLPLCAEKFYKNESSDKENQNPSSLSSSSSSSKRRPSKQRQNESPLAVPLSSSSTSSKKRSSIQENVASPLAVPLPSTSSSLKVQSSTENKYSRNSDSVSQSTQNNSDADVNLGVKLLCSLIEARSLNNQQKKLLAKKIISKITKKHISTTTLSSINDKATTMTTTTTTTTTHPAPTTTTSSNTSKTQSRTSVISTSNNIISSEGANIRKYNNVSVQTMKTNSNSSLTEGIYHSVNDRTNNHIELNNKQQKETKKFSNKNNTRNENQLTNINNKNLPSQPSSSTSIALKNSDQQVRKANAVEKQSESKSSSISAVLSKHSGQTSNSLASDKNYLLQNWLGNITKSEKLHAQRKMEKEKQPIDKMASGDFVLNNGTTNNIGKYLELERANHLNWIDNEIKHLENLKKLLILDKKPAQNFIPVEPQVTVAYPILTNYNTSSTYDKVASSKSKSPPASTQSAPARVQQPIPTNFEVVELQRVESETEILNPKEKYSRKVKRITDEILYDKADGVSLNSETGHYMKVTTYTVNEEKRFPKKDYMLPNKKVDRSKLETPLGSAKEVTETSKSSPDCNYYYSKLKNFTERDSRKSSTRSEAYAAPHSTDFSSGSISIPIVQDSSTLTTTTHQYDRHIGVAVQTSDSMLRTQPIFGPQTTTYRTSGIKYGVRPTIREYQPSTNKQAQTQVKPCAVAYVINFDRKKNKSSNKSDDITNENGYSLQEYLHHKRPDFSERVKERQKILDEMKCFRQIRQKKIEEIIENASDSSISQKLKNLPPPPIKCVRIFDTKEMKAMTKRHCQKLPEVLAKADQQAKERTKRNNRVLAQVFNKRLQKRVRKGKLSLEHSKTVI